MCASPNLSLGVITGHEGPLRVNSVMNLTPRESDETGVQYFRLQRQSTGKRRT